MRAPLRSAALLIALLPLTFTAAHAACPTSAPPYGSISVTGGCPSGDPCPLNTPITFTISSTIQSCDTIAWTFGDGTTTTTTGTPSVNHTFTQPGRYGPAGVVTNSMGSAHLSMSPRYFAAGWIGASVSSQQTMENAGSVTVNVIRSSAGGSASIHYQTSDSQGAAGTRYVVTSGTLNFAAGESSKSITVTLIDDHVVNSDYIFTVVLSRLSGDYIVPSYDPNIHYYPYSGVYVQDDEVPPTVQFDHSSYSVTDTAQTMNVVLLRSGDMTQTFTASWVVQYDPYGSSGGNDEMVRSAFTGATSGTITFPANVAQVPLTLAIRNDGLYTGDIQGHLSLYHFSVPVGGLGPPFGNSMSAAVTVTETQPRPDLTVDDTTVVNNGPGTKSANFRLHMSGPMRFPVSINCDANDGTAKLGEDYQGGLDVTTFNAGQTTSQCSIPVIGRTDVQPDKTFTLYVHPGCCNPIPNVLRSIATCTIINGNARLTPASVTLVPGGTTSLAIDIGQRGTPPAPFAISSSDPSVVTAPATVSFGSGSTHTEIPIAAVDGGAASISVTLPANMGGNVYTAQVNVPVTLSFDAPGSVSADKSSAVRLFVNPPLLVPVTATISVADPAIISAPSSVTVQPGQPAVFSVRGLKPGMTALQAQLPAKYGTSASATVAVKAGSPSISFVSPVSGPAAGGTAVTITGSALTADCRVSFGGTPVDHLAFVSATTITAITRFHAPGSVAVSLDCAGGVFTLANAFLYGAAPVSIASVTPSSGPAGGGTLTRIIGTNFLPGCWPVFGGAAASAVLSSSPGEIIAATAPHANGTVTLTVRCSDTAASLIDAFTYSDAPAPAPLISSVDPLAASAGQPVTISGTGFSMRDRVSFDATPAAILSAAPDTLVVRVPDMPAGKVSINVADSTTGPVFSIIDAAPRITSAAPLTVCAGSEVVLEGSGFRPDLPVTVGHVNAAIVALSYDRAVIRVPDVAAGTYALNIGSSSGPSLTVGSSRCVVVASITPSCATSDGVVAFTLRGTGFESGASVMLDGAAIDGVTIVDSTTMNGYLPMTMPGWPVIAVLNPSGSSGTLTGALSIVSPFDPNRCGLRRRPGGH